MTTSIVREKGWDTITWDEQSVFRIDTCFIVSIRAYRMSYTTMSIETND